MLRVDTPPNDTLMMTAKGWRLFNNSINVKNLTTHNLCGTKSIMQILKGSRVFSQLAYTFSLLDMTLPTFQPLRPAPSFEL